jgi:hypothetical protein
MNVSSPKRLRSRSDPLRRDRTNLSTSNCRRCSVNLYLPSRDCCTSKRKIFLGENVEFSDVSPSFSQNSLKVLPYMSRVVPLVAPKNRDPRSSPAVQAFPTWSTCPLAKPAIIAGFVAIIDFLLCAISVVHPQRGRPVSLWFKKKYRASHVSRARPGWREAPPGGTPRAARGRARSERVVAFFSGAPAGRGRTFAARTFLPL